MKNSSHQKFGSIYVINKNITTRVTNGAEIFHQCFNSEFYTPNPSVYFMVNVVDVLRNIHIDTLVSMNQYPEKISNIVRPIEKQVS